MSGYDRLSGSLSNTSKPLGFQRESQRSLLNKKVLLREQKEQIIHLSREGMTGGGPPRDG